MINLFACNLRRYMQGLLLVGMSLLLGCTAMYSFAYAKGENLSIQLANMGSHKLDDIVILTDLYGPLKKISLGTWIEPKALPGGGGITYVQELKLDVPKHFVVKWRTPDGILHKEELHLNVPEGNERDNYMPHRKRCWNIIIGFTEDGVTYGWTMTECPTAENQYEPRPVVYGGSRELLIFTNWFLTPDEADSLPFYK